MGREYWMVHWRMTSSQKWSFKFCESEAEARAIMQGFTTSGAIADCWSLLH